MKKILNIIIFTLASFFLNSCYCQKRAFIDNVYKKIVLAIENNEKGSILNDTLSFVPENKIIINNLSRQYFLNKYWGKFREYYFGTDFVVNKNTSLDGVYYIYNHCYKHAIFVNTKGKITRIEEIIVTQDLPCIE
jgi:hypothetical protein